MEATRNHMAQGLSCTVDASSLQYFGAQAALAQEQTYVVKHCFDEKSVVEEVVVVSTQYDQGVFPVLPCNTSSLSTLLEGKHVYRPSLSNQRRRPTSFGPLTFADDRFSS